MSLQTTGRITRTSERASVWQDVASDVSLYCISSVSLGIRGVRLQVAHVFWDNTSSALVPMVARALRRAEFRGVSSTKNREAKLSN